MIHSFRSTLTPSLATVRRLALLASALALTAQMAVAEEYMQRGASVEDYQQALGRVLERKRGVVTARQRMEARSKSPTNQSTSASKPKSATASRPRTQAGAQVAQPEVYSPEAPADASTADGVSIYFGYNSASLTEDARDALQKLGSALQAPEFAEIYWLIEGHTDASGGTDYNQKLSEARAISARYFLIESGGIAPDKLITVGKGESQLYDPSHPDASINRRVRLRPIGGAQ